MSGNKTFWVVALVFITCIALTLAGMATADEKEKPKPLRITLAGHSVGGSASVLAEAIGEAIKRTIPGTAFTCEPGRSGANEVTVSTGKTELGLSHVWTTKAAMNGTEYYKQKYPNLRVIAYLNDSAFYMVIRKDAGINSLEQIKEKKFGLIAGVNPKNSIMEVNTRHVLESYGITYADIEKWGGKILYLPALPTFELIRNNRANAFFALYAPPFSSLNDLATNVDVTILPLNDAVIQTVMEKMGGGEKYVHKKSDYPNILTKDVNSFGLPHILITRAELPDEQAYWITRAIYENLDYLKKASQNPTLMNKETIAKKIGGLPLHPGAEKYYREIGLIK